VVGSIILVALLALSITVFARRVLLLYRLIRLGQPVDRFHDIGRRLEFEATVVLGQGKLLQRTLPGLMHAFIFWGFLVLLTTIVEAVGQIADRDFVIPLIGDTPVLNLVQDLFAGLVLVGIGIAFYIRKIQRPERFVGSHLREADYILLWIAGIIVTLFGIKSTAIALAGGYGGQIPDLPRPDALANAGWYFISNPISNLWGGLGPDALSTLNYAFLWAHVLLILGFLAYIPYSKHLHIVTSAFNVFFSNTKPRGTLRPVRIDLEALETSEEMPVLGAATLEDLTWKEALDLYACTECGRCQHVCPAWNTGKPLSPKLLIMNLRDHLFEDGPRILAAKQRGEGEYEKVPLNPDVVDDEVVWACVTCGACMQECPVNIEHVDHIVDMRRNLVMAESRFPAEAGTLLRNLESASNPWGMSQSQRGDWARGLDVPVADGTAPEYLYWVGCAGSFDDRAKRISRALSQALVKAEVDFAILGPDELCTGDPARRIGNEYLFQMLAEQNVGTLNARGVRKIVANCPHCFNTLRNEYPEYGGTFEVMHHTQLLARLIEEGRLRPTEEVRTLLTYHDPCYLGRHNGVYGEPRRVLQAVPGLRTVEMERHRERAFCCGAGGSRMWLEEHLGKRINRERTEEAVATGAETLGVGCPYCMIMLDDGSRDKGGPIEVLDVAQVVARSVGAEASPPAAGNTGTGSPGEDSSPGRDGGAERDASQ
jgi:Fe-S oxidoreductase